MARPGTRPNPAPAVAGVAVLGAAIGLLGWLVLSALGLQGRPAYCAGVGIAGAAVIAAVRAIGRDDAPAPATARIPADDEGGAYADLFFIEYRLSWGAGDPGRFDDRVRPTLVRLADERLRQRRGIDRARDPERARQIVGERLWTLMTPAARTTRRPRAPEVAEFIAAIEAI